ERLELAVVLAREVDLRKAVAGQVVRGDAHALDLGRKEAIGGRVFPRDDAGLDPPQLLPPEARRVVVAVVADTEVHPAGPVPVAEEHRQRAEGRLELDRAPETLA